MQTVQVGTTGRTTTQLGYGCPSLMGAMGRAESLAVLEAAFDAGSCHFDVAPMAGYGQAESCFGEFLARHRGQAIRDEVTITTKYGIPAASGQRLTSLASTVARPVKAMPRPESPAPRLYALFQSETAMASLWNERAAG
jgi:aryl-alcohol dehydrogenase-like predicted oxidoreductase